MDNGELRLVKLARKGDREAFTQLVVAKPTSGCSPGWPWPR